MILLRLARGNYEVLAVAEADGTCQVLEHLLDADLDCPDAAAQMRQILFEDVPEGGPDLSDTDRSKHLRDGIHSFRTREVVRPRRKRGKPERRALRVLSFQVGDGRVVCTMGFTKQPGDKTPEGAIEAAILQKKAYEKAQYYDDLVVKNL